jgi:phenylpropionate dioxygenase-like ring-hydroxylating dioxygenase large terminal subunit
MWMNRWYPVLEASRLTKRRPVVVRRFGEDFVLWRGADGIVAWRDRCPHRGVSFARGSVQDGVLVCPYHGFRYDADGACTHVPCDPSRHIPPRLQLDGALSVVERHDLIWAWWGNEAPSGEPAWLPAPGTWSETSQDWPYAHERVAESFFDLHHVPFAHASINPGFRPELLDYQVAVDGDSIRTRGAFARASGRRVAFTIDFAAPCLFRIDFGPGAGVICATPINAEHTWVWARYASPVPVVGGLIAWLGLYFDMMWVQTFEDRPLLDTQRPKHPTADSDVLVASDAGMAAYRRLLRQSERAPA